MKEHWIYICGVFVGWITQAIANELTENIFFQIIIRVMPCLFIWIILRILIISIEDKKLH